MIYKLLACLIALLVGGWMLVDGIHCVSRGKYIGPEKPGPWSIPFAAMGINPFRLAPMFIVLGTLWLLSLIFLLAGPAHLASRAWLASLLVAIASLWYLPVGTVLSLAYILLLIFARSHLMPAP